MSEWYDRKAEKHWRLGPSSSSRWLNCPGSARDDLPNPETIYSKRGHELHDQAVWYLQDGLPVFGDDQDSEDVRLCTDFADSLKGAKHFEVQIESDEVDDHGGTIDVLETTDESLHVVDFKFGKIPVAVKTNTQIACYINLAREVVGDRRKFFGTVAQPYRGQPKTFRFTRHFLDQTRATAKKVAHDDRLVAGPWCQYCPLKPVCEVHRDYESAQ